MIDVTEVFLNYFENWVNSYFECTDRFLGIKLYCCIAFCILSGKYVIEPDLS